MAKIEAAQKVFNEMIDRYVRNDIDYVYYGELYKREPKGLPERKEYMQKQMTASNNMDEIEITIQSTVSKIKEYSKLAGLIK